MYEIGPFHYHFSRGNKAIFCKEKLIIQSGELVVITGPSGSGKSTLLQILKGIIPEFKAGELTGTVTFNGEALNGAGFTKNLKEILFLFQNPFSQLLYQNASEEFFFSMENFGFSKEEMDKRRAELEDYFQLDGLWNKKTNNLSNGECQRLVLASLLAVNPSVLLLDEPTAFLDTQSRKEFYDWLVQMKGQRTVVLIDHHIDEILPQADRVLLVDHDGELKASTPEPHVEVSFEWPALKKTEEQISLRLNHVYFHYTEQKTLLRDLTLSASSRDIVLIKGKNGKGKSTLFKLMAGLLKPLEGEVEMTVNGSMLPFKKRRNHIGFVFQNPETHFFYDTVDEELQQVPTSDKEKILQHFFKEIQLARSPFLLSEGEKRRLSLLIVIYQNRSVLFYDEPTFGQDKKSVDMIRSMILQQQKMGKIQFLISHDDHFIESLNPIIYQLEDQTLKRQ
jgi:energy-coupling factor transport system ATP-binding protein